MAKATLGARPGWSQKSGATVEWNSNFFRKCKFHDVFLVVTPLTVIYKELASRIKGPPIGAILFGGKSAVVS